MRAFVAFIGALALVLLVGCSPERQGWRSAEAADTIESYERFLRRFPESERAPQARARIAQLAEKRDWERASELNTLQAYRRFLAQYPEGQYAQEARIRVESFELGPPPAQPEAPGPATPTPASAAGEPASTEPAQARYGIQLGAFSTEESARTEWKRVSARFQKELGSMQPVTVPFDSGGRRLFRLQAFVSDEAQARALCERLNAAAQPCVVVLPR